MSIQLNNITKNFKNIKALKNLSIDFQPGKINGLIGFNGSGKTTTFNIIANFLEEYNGSILIGNKPLKTSDLESFSYMSAGSESNNIDKAIDHLLYVGALYGITLDVTKKLINNFAIKLGFTEELTKKIKNLSKGNQQKVKIISALLNPKLKYLLLDEPFEGLDPIMVRRITEIITYLANEAVTIIITSHRMDIVDQICDVFYILKKGELVFSKKRNEKETIFMYVNKEVDITPIKQFEFVLSTSITNKDTLIEFENIDNFKKINLELIKSDKYVYSSIKKDETISALFERYASE